MDSAKPRFLESFFVALAFTRTFSANPPTSIVLPRTRSPILKELTPSPTSMTTPATSPPGTKGSWGLNWYLSSIISASGKVTVEARASMTNSPGPALGSSISSSTRFSGGPNSLQTITFTAGSLAGINEVLTHA